MDCRSLSSARSVCTRTRGVHRRRPWRLRRQRGMVRTWPTGSVCAVLSRERSVCESREHQQYDGERHAGNQRLSHDHHQQHHQHHERDVCEPQRAGRSDGGFAARVFQRAARGKSCGSSKPTTDRICPLERQGGRSSHARECSRSQSRDCGTCDCSTRGGGEPASGSQEDAATAAGSVRQAAAGAGRASGTAVG